jgi:hypothetical protein
MLGTMPPKKRKPDRVGRAPKNPGMLLLRLDEDTVAALTAYLASLEVPPERTAVGLAALRKFLAERGFPPKPKN